MILKGRELGMKIMMGSMNESSIGAAAVANFLPQLDYVDMDGPLLLSQDMATGIHFDYGAITLEGSAGLGVRVHL